MGSRMTTRTRTTVIDAGGRYGLHPTWKSFTGELDYYLFEPDSTEAARLVQKYKERAVEIKVIDCALLDKDGTATLFLFRNRAMSSVHKRTPVSPLFVGERQNQVNVDDRREVKVTSIDSFCDQNSLSVDFMKLDTEGSDYAILEGAKAQLNESVLGIRCEVSFDYLFENAPLFSKIHDLMMAHDFYLLNLDYNGKGDYCNEFVGTNGKYGILTFCDGVWLKRRERLFGALSIGGSNAEMEARVLKYAAFCLINNASDVAVDVLLQARHEFHLDFLELKESRLYRFVDISINKLFYSLKWEPGHSLEKHGETYFEIFNKRMLEMHEYNQSIELNPD